MKCSFAAKWITILLLTFFSLGYSTADIGVACSNKTVKQYYSTYTIFDVIRYRGGLTTELEAKNRIGKQVILQKNSFHFVDTSIKRPTYKLRFYPELPEGEVDTNRWSNFYGLGMDRTCIEVIEIYDSTLKMDKPYTNIEIVGDELWKLSDGWLYKMKQSKQVLPSKSERDDW